MVVPLFLTTIVISHEAFLVILVPSFGLWSTKSHLLPEDPAVCPPVVPPEEVALVAVAATVAVPFAVVLPALGVAVAVPWLAGVEEGAIVLVGATVSVGAVVAVGCGSLVAFELIWA